jgi:hypothetical protein
MSFSEVPSKATRSPLLGQGSLALIISAIAAASFAMGPIATAMGEYVKATGSIQISASAAELIATSVSGSVSVFQFSSYAGISAALAGLVAAITNRGRWPGAAAAILGVVGPAFPIMVGVVILMPIAQMIS